MRKTNLARIAICAVVIAKPVIAHGQVASHRAGQTINLAPDVTLRVVAANLDAFRDISLAGAGEVFELEFEKSAGRIVVLEPWNDPANSGVAFVVSATRIAPTALALRKPQGAEWEVIAVDKLERNRVNGRGAWVGFAGRSKVQFLFDVPKEFADSPTTLAVDVLLDGRPPPLRIEIVKEP